MIKLLDILKEAKQVGSLYHWTDFVGSLNIISQNFLKGYITDTFKQPAISFTRDKNFYKGKNKLATKPEICFIIDGDKLSNHYKIQPFQDSTIKKDEMEEKVITEGIKNFSQYVTKIIIIKNRFNKSPIYSPDQIENKWKLVGGEGYPNYKKYIEWLTSKGFNIENILNEAKQVGTLYHFTSLKNLLSIIQNNTLIASNTTDFIDKKLKLQCVSLTRTSNKNQFSISNKSECVLILDGDKLSNKYKITPYHDPNQYYFSDEEYDEMEERICKNIVNLDKYIIKIILSKPNPEIESLLKEKNIPYEIK